MGNVCVDLACNILGELASAGGDEPAPSAPALAPSPSPSAAAPRPRGAGNSSAAAAASASDTREVDLTARVVPGGAPSKAARRARKKAAAGKQPAGKQPAGKRKRKGSSSSDDE